MKRILIIEDERLSANRLMRLLKDIDDTLQVEGPLTTVKEVVDTLREDNAFNLIFSDIRLHDSLVFEAFREVMPRAMVIFTTAYDQYALDAFRHNGIDYLLKPIDASDLLHAVTKAKELLTPPIEASRLNAVSRQMNSFRERILVISGDELIPLRAENIRYFCKENNGVMAHTASGDTVRISMTMNELEEQLNPKLFFRLNRQYIAHIDAIRKISFFFSSKLIVRLDGCDDDNIIISKEKSVQFRQWLDR